MSFKQWLENIYLDKEMKKKIDFFRKVSIFQGLTTYDVGVLVTVMYRRAYEAGEVICPEHEIGKALFIIMDGEVVISRKAGLLKEEKVITRMKSGDFFGEMSLLEEKPRSGTAKAMSNCDIYIIYKANFDGMVEKKPRIGVQVIRNIAVVISGRLRGIMGQLS